MAQQIIKVGASANDGQGNPIRTSFIKCNDNFSELYARAQTSPPPTLVGSLGDFAGMYAYDSSFFYYCFANYDGSSVIWAQISDTGNVSATQLLFGTTTVDIPTANANVVFTVDNTANVAVFSSGGVDIAGYATITGNIQGANLFATNQISATGNTVSGNVLSLGIVSASGNIVANYFLGNGSLLTGLPETYANSNVANYLPTYTGNLVSLAGPVITTANLTAGNILTGGIVSSAGNITAGNIASAGTITATANVVGGNLVSLANVNGGNLIATNDISAGGNITGAFFSGNGAGLTGVIATGNVGAASQLANGTSVLNIPTADGNIIGNISGTANVFIMANTGLYVNALISASGHVVGANLITPGLVSASGNVSALNVNTSQRVSAFGNIVTSGSFVASGNLSVNGNAIASNYQGVSVSMSGNVVAGNLQTAGTVNAGIITATGNITGGNIRTAGVITAAGNIDGANLTTGGRVLATGNVTGGNLTTGGTMSAIGNITGQNFLTLGIVSSAGNIAGLNLTAASNISAGNMQITSLANIGSLTVTNDAIIGGNLTVNGNTNYTNVETFTVEDPIIGIGRGANNSPLVSDDGKDRGEQLWYYSGSEKSAFIGLDNSAGKLLGATDVTITNELVSVNAYGNVIFGNIEAQGTVSATGNVTGANVNTNGLLSANGNITGGNLVSSGAISATGNIQGGNIRTAGAISATGTITGAAITGSSLTVNTGNINCGNIVNNNANGVGNIGSASTYFNTVFATATRAQYADLAEVYTSDANYEPGVVIMFGGEQEVTRCDHDACPAVVGVVSTNPAYLMNSALESEHVVAVALMGRVPCKVRGPVKRGDLMVSAGNGLARSESNPKPGTMIGKAVESFDGDIGTIEILVGKV